MRTIQFLIYIFHKRTSFCYFIGLSDKAKPFAKYNLINR